MKLTSEEAMMLGTIISCAGQDHYDGKRDVSKMIDAEIQDAWRSMRDAIQNDPNEEDERWIAAKLKKCAKLREWKSYFEDIEC